MSRWWQKMILDCNKIHITAVSDQSTNLSFDLKLFCLLNYKNTCICYKLKRFLRQLRTNGVIRFIFNGRNLRSSFTSTCARNKDFLVNERLNVISTYFISIISIHFVFIFLSFLHFYTGDELLNAFCRVHTREDWKGVMFSPTNMKIVSKALISELWLIFLTNEH